MSLSPLLPFAGAALGPVLEKTLDGISQALSFLDVLHASPIAPEQPVSEDSTLDPLATQLTQVMEQLRERLDSIGIDLSTPVRLKSDGGGGVIVDGDHPDRVVIESLLNADADLTALFHTVASRAAEEAEPRPTRTAEDFRLIIEPADARIEFE